MRLNGKVALITGASEGIGAACAVEFAKAGAQLSLTARSEEGLARVGGSTALITPGDLTDENTRRAVVDRTLQRFGTIDILINSAGVGLYEPSWSASDEYVRRLMELNFFALLGMIQLVAPQMRARHSGMIVNLSSIAGKMPLPWATLYSASKYAVGALTEGLRMELRADGVRTMLVCPSYVSTAFQQRVIAGRPPEPVLRRRTSAITATHCARAIRRGVERDSRTIMAPWNSWLIIAAARLFPSIVESQLARMNGTA